jgi:outer membrane protein
LQKARWMMSCGLALLLIPMAGGKGHAETFTLEQALALAYETNPRLDAERAQLRATDEDVAKALSGWRPSVGVSGSYGYTSNDTNQPIFSIPNGHPEDVTVTLTQPLFTGSTIAQTRQAKSAVLAGRAQLTSVEQMVLNSAARAYFDVVSDEASLNFKRDNVSLLTDNFHMTEERVKIGDVTRTDLELVRSRLSSAIADVALAEAKFASSRAEFARAVGRPAESLEPNPRLPLIPSNEEQALGLALDNNPDLAAAREQARTADAAVDVAVGALLPSLSLQGQYRRSRDEVATGVTDNSLSLMAQLRIPLYQGGGEYSDIRKAKELRSKAAFAISDTERQIRQALDTAWQTQSAAHVAIASHEQQVAAAQAAYEGFAEGIRVGERTTFDLLNAAQELVSARVALADVRHQYLISSFDLIVAMGGLTARSFNLPLKLYDPEEHYKRDAARWVGFGR